MRAFIIEDEPRARRNLENLLARHFPQIQVVGSAGSVRESLVWLSGHDGVKAPAPDMIFMDVELSDGNCFDIFAQTDIQVPVIMTTAYDHYAVKAFEVHSVDYLLKPLEVDALRRAISRAVAEHAPSRAEMLKVMEAFQSFQQGMEESYGPAPAHNTPGKEKFLIRLNDRIVPVHTRDIAYFYSEAKNSYIVTKGNRTYVLDDSLDAIEQCLSPDAFFRISRSCIVAEEAIDSVS